MKQREKSSTVSVKKKGLNGYKSSGKERTDRNGNTITTQIGRFQIDTSQYNGRGTVRNPRNRFEQTATNEDKTVPSCTGGPETT